MSPNKLQYRNYKQVETDLLLKSCWKPASSNKIYRKGKRPLCKQEKQKGVSKNNEISTHFKNYFNDISNKGT